MHAPTFVTLALVVLGLGSIARGQQCPDWAPQFDQIQSPQMRQAVESNRQRGWDHVIQQGIAQGASLDQQIAQGESALPTLRQTAANAQQCIAQIGSGPGSGRVSGAQCDHLPQGAGALMACQCQESITNDTILATQGTIDLMKCRRGNGFHATPTPLGGASGNASHPDLGESDSGSAAITPMQRGAKSVADLNVAKRGNMVNSATNSWQPPSEMRNSSETSSQSAALADPFADSEVKDAASKSPPSDENSSDNSDARRAVGNSASDSSSGSSSARDNSWNDPLAADNGSFSRELAFDQSQVNPEPTQEEVAKTLEAGVSNSAETSAAPVGTVANSGRWGDFASSPFNSPSSSAADPPPSVTSDGNTSARDATDEEIDRRIDDVDLVRSNILEKGLPHNAASDKVMDQGIGVIRAVDHQMNHTLNDAADGLFSDDPSQVKKVNDDIEGFGPAIGNALIPKWAQTLNQDATKIQNTVTRTVNKVSCLFSFDPYCK